MPILSRFNGIVMKMYFQQAEHNPPHVHAQYGDYSAEFEIETGMLLEGRFPHKSMLLVQRWILIHRSELLEIWNSQNFKPISPL